MKLFVIVDVEINETWRGEVEVKTFDRLLTQAEFDAWLERNEYVAGPGDYIYNELGQKTGYEVIEFDKPVK